MKFVFLGTRGNIDACTDKHHYQTTLKVSYYGTDIVIDCGENWLGEVKNWQVGAIILTMHIQIMHWN